MPFQMNELQIEDGVVRVVKNTFITMLPSSSPSTARRQTSLPASLRLRQGCDETSSCEQEPFTCLFSKDCLYAENLSDACTEVNDDDVASTRTLPISDSDDSSNAGMSPDISPVSPDWPSIADESPTFGMSPVSSEVGDWPYQCDLSSYEAQPITEVERFPQSPQNECFLCMPQPMTRAVSDWSTQDCGGNSSRSMLSTKPKSTPLKSTPLQSKLSSKAVAFKPMVAEESQKSRLSVAAQSFRPKASEEQPTPKPVEEPSKPTTDKFSFVIREAVRLLQNSGFTASIEVVENAQECSIIVQMGAGDESLADQILTLAKQALLEAASHSKSVYVLGYCTPNPFTMMPHGFEATLGSMENAGQACWHLFKKGFCRHDNECNKQHPTHRVPVRVFVEHASYKCSQPEVLDFKLRVADLVSTVTSALKQHPLAAQVEAHRNTTSKGWTVELSPSGKGHKEELLAYAQELLRGTLNNSDVLYMMGNNAKPFLTKPDGFVTVLGDMQAETKACWDLYALGFCRRECACRWEHPSCLVPISLVIKPCKKRISSR